MSYLYIYIYFFFFLLHYIPGYFPYINGTFNQASSQSCGDRI